MMGTLEMAAAAATTVATATTTTKITFSAAAITKFCEVLMQFVSLCPSVRFFDNLISF